VEQRYSGSWRHANSTSKRLATQTQPMHETAEMPISIGYQNRTKPPNSPPATHARKEQGNAGKRDAPCCRQQQRRHRRAGTARTPPPPPARTPSLPCPRLRLRSAVPPATAAAAFGSAQPPAPIWRGGG
jgi:hypothetical protein